MGTALGQVIDYMVAGLPSAIAAVDPNAVVADNWPETEAVSYLVIGRHDVESAHAGDGDNAWYDIGAQRIEESFSIPCFVEAVRPGPSQKPARDAAIALFDATVAFIKSDVALGGVLNRGRVAIASRVALDQTAGDGDTGEAGNALRRAVLSFELVCKNTYT